MIMRILGEGQYSVPDDGVAGLNDLDDALIGAVDSGDEAAFATALHGLLAEVRRLGTPLPSDTLTASELVLPDEDTSLTQVRALLGDEGFIPD